ncbi:dihydrolipoyl dehydrogenase [Gordonia terrae]
MTEVTADLIVLGGGSGGYACALRAAQLGSSVVLIEKDRLGGTCLHRGCIPTKALLHAAEVADSSRDAHRFGVKTELLGVDMAAVNRYKDAVVSRLYSGLQGLVNSRAIEVVAGDGRLIGGTAVQVGDRVYRGRNVVLATGSYPKMIAGIEPDDRIITSERALQLTELPRRAVVLGGGVIGVEFASAWRSLGAEVSIVEAFPRLLPNEDEFASKHLERALSRRGIDVRTGTALDGAKTGADEVQVTLSSGDVLTADVLLVAVGRGPNTAGSGFAEAGLMMTDDFAVTDDTLQTSIPGVYAVGDIVPGPQLAHRGFAQGLFVAELLAGLEPKPVAVEGIPRVAYSDPEVASVGLTEAAARSTYGAVDTVTYDLAGNGKSQILHTQGAVKLVRARSEGSSGPIVGVHMVGSRVGELIGEAQLIYNWQAEADDITPLIHAHPTQNEALGEAVLALAGQPLHAHG